MSRGAIPNSIVLGHYGGRPVAPSTTCAPTARRGGRRLRTAAAAAAAASIAAATIIAVDVLFVIRFAVVEPGVDVELILAKRAILAEATAFFTAHEPYRVLDELHRGAEDVARAVEIRVRPRVGRIRFDALLVQPEGVA